MIRTKSFAGSDIDNKINEFLAAYPKYQYVDLKIAACQGSFCPYVYTILIYEDNVKAG